MGKVGEKLGMKIIEMPISKIVPYANNPRDNDRAVDAVAASIREFGFKVPVIVDRDNVIVAGHTRIKAAEKLGLSTVPVIRADDLTEEQVRAFRLADNKTSELAEWDFSKLEKEMEKLRKIDMSKFGFSKEDHEWFDRQKKEYAEKQERNDEYNEFLDKFEVKKTTDDCYTPENVYKAVADFVAAEYDLNPLNFVRPFYPGGDYQNFNYRKNSVVVDNPPFSIMAEIIAFYMQKNIPFFLFAPSLALFHHITKGTTAICTGVQVEYENTAKVPTSFLTNLEKDGTAVRTAPELSAAIEKANKENRKTRQLPKYIFPVNVLTAAKMNYISQYGQLLKIKRQDLVVIDQLDAMKEDKKTIYGGGILISERAAAERTAAERAAAERAAAERENTWQLSDREKEIIAGLGRE